MSLMDNVNSLRQETQTAVGQLLKTVKTAGSETNNEEYRRLLEECKSCLLECRERLEQLSAKGEDQMAAIQVALDLTYIKEELDGIVQVQKISSDKISKIDTTIIEPIKKDYTANRVATVEKLDEVLETVNKKNQGLRYVLGFSLLLNMASLGGLIFIILWILQIL
ncbi:MAG: hypothetical protein ACOCMZ_01160 [Acetivibrio ethanolgignens]